MGLPHRANTPPPLDHRNEGDCHARSDLDWNTSETVKRAAGVQQRTTLQGLFGKAAGGRLHLRSRGADYLFQSASRAALGQIPEAERPGGSLLWFVQVIRDGRVADPACRMLDGPGIAKYARIQRARNHD